MRAQIQNLDRYTLLQRLSDDIVLDDKSLEQLIVCANLSQHLFAGYIDDKLICVYGLAPSCLLSEDAYLWLYVTPHMKEHTFMFVRHSQLAVENMLEEYPTIKGDVIIENKQAQRWLKWLGAEFGEPNGVKIPFKIRRKHG
jgi:hypothetical protein